MPRELDMGELNGLSGTRMNVGLKDLTAVECEKCKGEVFQEGVMLRSVSALLTGNGKEGMLPVPVFFCINCREPLNKYLPEELKRKKVVV